MPACPFTGEFLPLSVRSTKEIDSSVMSLVSGFSRSSSVSVQYTYLRLRHNEGYRRTFCLTSCLVSGLSSAAPTRASGEMLLLTSEE